VLALSGTFDQLTDCLLFASWIFYGLVTSSVFVLRRRRKDLPRPYRTFGYPVVPAVFVVVALALIVNTLFQRPVESAVGLGLIALGLPVYAFFRARERAPAPGTLAPRA
jgi:APA family basic amino acid/polyamine antiporter